MHNFIQALFLATLSATLCCGSGSPAPASYPAPHGSRIVVPDGTFRIGSPVAEQGRDTDEGPQIEFAFESFLIDATPVTAADFEAREASLRDAEPLARWWRDAETPSGWLGRCNLGSTRRDHPMNCVNWHAAHAYCRAMNGDLPTEAEWEYSARAGTQTAYFWGDTFDSEHAVSSIACGPRGCCSGTSAVVVSGPRCNPWGVCDALGNVWQWTQSEYQPQLSADANARTTTTPTQAVHRGGAWLDNEPHVLRSALRGLNYPEHGLTGVGFRCIYR